TRDVKYSKYVNVCTNNCIYAHIWKYQDRMINVGDALPKNDESTEISDCTGQYIVPGYIESHAHPFYLYNPEEFAYHCAKYGTTTLINDNNQMISLFNKQNSFQLIKDFDRLPVSMFWWARYDSQSM